MVTIDGRNMLVTCYLNVLEVAAVCRTDEHTLIRRS